MVKESAGKIDVETIKLMEADNTIRLKQRRAERAQPFADASKRSPRGIPEWDWGKFYPGGTVQAKSCRFADGLDDAILGCQWTSVRLRFCGGDLSERSSGIWMDEWDFAGTCLRSRGRPSPAA